MNGRIPVPWFISAALFSSVVSMLAGLLGHEAGANVPQSILVGLASFATCLTLALKVMREVGTQGPADPTGPLRQQ